VAFFDFTGCEGCQLQVLSLEAESLLALLSQVEVVNFREATSRREEDYDIAFIDGGLSTEEDLARIRRIRQQAKILVTLGACASLGGINCQKNFLPADEVLRYVYGEGARYFSHVPARPVWAEVQVEYMVPGCPIDQDEFVQIVSAILSGKTPRLPNYPVCFECRSKGNVCMYDKGLVCLGPVSRAGCGAICPSYGNYCWGCRGLVDSPNIAAKKDILRQHGMSYERILQFFRSGLGFLEVAQGE